MKKAKFTIQKQDISEYPTNKQRIVKFLKISSYSILAVTILLITYLLASKVNGSIEKYQENARTQDDSRVVRKHLTEWKQARFECNIENTITELPIDGGIDLTLDLEIPFESLQSWSGSIYETQVNCFSKKIYGLSLADKFTFNSSLTKLQDSIFLDSNFNKINGSHTPSGLWVLIDSAAAKDYAGFKRNSIVLTFWWAH